MRLMVPASGIYGATVSRSKMGSGGAMQIRLFLSSFSLSIGTETLRLQNVQKPSTVNVSMQITSMEECWNKIFQPNPPEPSTPSAHIGMGSTPWARNIREDSRYSPFDGYLDSNELYVVLQINQGFYGHRNISDGTREKYQVIRITDIIFDIPEYSAVSRGESATLNTFTLNGVADAREPVLMGPVSKNRADQILKGYGPSTGSAFLSAGQWPVSASGLTPADPYVVLQTGEMFNE